MDSGGERSRGIAVPWLALVAAAAAVTWPAAARADDCQNAAYRTGASAVLPDCRAFEQVSPVVKEGTEAVGDGLVAGTSGTVRYAARGVFGDSPSASQYPFYLGTRGTSGWTSNGLEPRTIGGDLDLSPYLKEASADQSRAVVFSRSALTDGAIDGGSNVYLQTLVAGVRSYQLIAAKSGQTLFNNRAVAVVGGTSDFSSVVLSSPFDLAGSGEEQASTRYYRFANGELEALATNVTDALTPQNFVYTNDAGRPVSTDGTRLTFLDDTAVYQADGPTARIVSHPPGRSGTRANGSSPVATPDGSSVFFASTEALAAGSRTDSASVYRWTNGTTTDLLTDARARNDDGDLAPITHPLSDLTVRGVSADGATVWFTSPARVLPNGPADGGLYLLDTATREVVLVKAVPPGTDPQYRFSAGGTAAAIVNRQNVGNSGDVGPCTADDGEGCADKLFVTVRDPNGVYAGFNCVTCGFSPYGRIDLGPSRATAVLDDGRLFFSSVAQLDPLLDLNARADLYAYDTRSDTRRLLSGGQGRYDAVFGGASSDGRDVFFVTPDALVAADTDTLADVYDARVGGGIAGQQQAPAQSAPCTDASCRPAPAAPAPPSGDAASSGDVPPAPAPLPVFSVGTPSKAALRGFARTGRLALKVKVGAAGTVSGELEAKLGGRTRTVASATTKATKARTVTVALRLSKPARRKLARRGRLTLRLTAAYSERTEQVRKTIRLTASKQKGGRR